MYSIAAIFCHKIRRISQHVPVSNLLSVLIQVGMRLNYGFIVSRLAFVEVKRDCMTIPCCRPPIGLAAGTTAMSAFSR